MMLGRCCLVKHTTGGTGAYVVVVIAYISGQMLQHLSCLMAAMDGSGLFWMGNLLQCTQVEALKGEPIALVSVATVCSMRK
jgi:hypothetical protein